MSGDVQARKRREKKKKKEDAPEEVVFQHQHQPPTSPNVTDDLNIHVQKEASTGGGLCAKFIFFILLTLLTTLIGLIITEHRGLTDLDTIDTESRFAQIFDGWVDKSPLDHDSHDDLSLEESEENLYEEEDDESHDQEDEDEVSEEKELDENASEEEDHDEDDDDDDEAEDEEEDEEEEEESDIQGEDTVERETDEVSNEVDDEDESQDEDDQEDDTQEYPSEDEEQSDEEQDNASLPTKEDLTQEEEEEDEDYSEDKDNQEESEEVKSKPKRKVKYADYSEDQEESEEIISKPKRKVIAKQDEESEEIKSKPKRKVIAKQDESEEIPDQTKSEEAESLEDVDEDTIEKPDDEDEAEKISDEDKTDKVEHSTKTIKTKVRQEKRSDTADKKSENEEEEVNEDVDPQETENSNMVVKFGVGTALLVVAHVVLVRKWRTEKVAETIPQAKTEEVDAAPDLTRRNTIVTPPNIEEIEQDIENVEEEYSEDEEDESEDDSRSKPTSAKMRYQELQSTYSHTLTPEWEPGEVRAKDDTNDDEEDDEEQPEGDEDYDDEISENEDEELLRRLEAKYGKIRQSDEEPDDEDEEDDEEEEEEEDDGNEKFNSWKRLKVPSDKVPEDSDSETEQQHWSKERSGAQAVDDFNNITNTNDWQIQEQLDQAHQNIANDAAFALTLFNKILERNPSSPRALFGKARSLDALAEKKRSNSLLQEAIVTYQLVLKTENIPDALFQMAAERCIDRIRFRGFYSQAVAIHKLLVDKFPHTVKFANQLAVTYLTINKINEAKKTLSETLVKWPNDGFALVHYGFILKTNDNDLEQAVEFLKKGIATKEPGVIDGRFYFHLGDALTRLGKKEDAMAVYIDGVKNKVFLSKYQRSLYNVERLTGKPWWKKEETPHMKFFRNLEDNWKNICDEGLTILDKRGYFKPEAENLRDVGDWKQFELFGRGIKNTKNCKQCPFTCSIIETFRDAIECRRGQIKFSVMHPGTHVWPHCGPTNCRLRAHLGLKVPLNTYIRVGEEIRSWKEGKLIIFDDSFEHEVWHNGTATRLVLIVDFWHPELTKEEKRSLSSI